MKFKALILAVATAQILSSCATNNTPPTQTLEQKKADVYYTEGTRELVNKKYLQALGNLLKAKEYDPKDSQIRNNLGMAYYFRNQPELAEQELKEAISLDKNNIDARLNLGSIYMNSKRYKEAREQYLMVEKNLTYESQFSNYYNLAVLELKEGDRKSAYDYLGKSLAEKSDYCPAHFMLGEMYSEEYRYSEALKSFKESVKGTCVNEAEPQFQIASTLLNLDRKSEAKAKFQEIIEKFSGTKFATMANAEIKKINQSSDESDLRSTKTERFRSTDTDPVETPNF